MFLPLDFEMPKEDGQYKPYKSNVFLQLHPNPDHGPPSFTLDVFIEPDTRRWVLRALSQAANGVQYRYTNGISTGIAGVRINENPQQQRGVWYDFVHHITWSANGNGRHEIWMRASGGSVQKVLDRPNINTLYAPTDKMYLKIGTYHNPLQQVPQVPSVSIIHDRIRMSLLSGTAGFDAVRMSDFPMQGSVPANGSVCSGDGLQ
jgi:hypothetical protein